MTFREFDLDPRCLDVLDKQEITKPTPIQEQAIPPAVAGKDVIGIAQTGTGKTFAFALPALTRLAAGDRGASRMLVLVPTRELCNQVFDVVRTFGKPLGVTCAAVYGGVSISRQADDMRKGAQVIVATPGRLLDHLSRRNVDFRKLEILVLDECDRMLDMGFLPDILKILRHLPRNRQTMAFSATLPPEIARLIDDFMHEPVRVTVGQISKPVDAVRQVVYPVREEDKIRLVQRVLDEEHVKSTIIFARRKDRTEQLANILESKGHRIAQIHGDRSQIQREQALKGFRKGKYDILCATDVAARGLDIDNVTHVVNFDIPPTVDDYVHRIGRTARAEAEGDAITFVTPTEYKELETIERALGRNIPRADWERAPIILTLYRPDRVKAARGRRAPARRSGRLLRRR